MRRRTDLLARRNPVKRTLTPILGCCFAAATLVGACGSSTGTRQAASTTSTAGPATTTASASTSTTSIVTATSVVGTSVAAAVPATTAAGTPVAPPTSFVFRSEHGPVPTEAVEIVANHSQFSVKSIDAKPGKLVVHLRNAEELDVRHEFLVTDQQGHRLARSDKFGTGEDVVFTIDDLKPGTYRFLCTIDGHDRGGMNGVLTRQRRLISPH